MIIKIMNPIKIVIIIIITTTTITISLLIIKIISDSLINNLLN